MSDLTARPIANCIKSIPSAYRIQLLPPLFFFPPPHCLSRSSATARAPQPFERPCRQHRHNTHVSRLRRRSRRHHDTLSNSRAPPCTLCVRHIVQPRFFLSFKRNDEFRCSCGSCGPTMKIKELVIEFCTLNNFYIDTIYFRYQTFVIYMRP